MSDLQQWARETAPTLTAEIWSEIRQRVTGANAWMDQNRALFSHLQEVARGLTKPQAEWLVKFSEGFCFRGRGSRVVLRGLQAKGLAEPEHGWPASEYGGEGPLSVRVLPFGFAVAHESQRKDGGSDGV